LPTRCGPKKFELGIDGSAGARKAPQIEVTSDIDTNGIYNASAQDKSTGKSSPEHEVGIDGSAGARKAPQIVAKFIRA